MRVLVIGVNYLPERTGIGPYTAELAQYLAGNDHEVDVITGRPSYPEWKVHEPYRRSWWMNEERDGVRIHRRWHYVPKKQSALRRLAYECSFLLMGSSAIRLAAPNLVVGVVPSLSGGVLARLTAKRFGVPYVLIVQDLMGLAAIQTGVTGGNAVAPFVTTVERWACQGATGIGIIADGFRPYLEGLGVCANRIRRVRNWSRLTHCTEPMETTRKRFGWALDSVVCLHAGNMGHKQGLENIVECARLAQSRCDNLRFVLMGDGSQKAALEQMAVEYGLGNLTFLPLQLEKDLPNILGAADVLLINQRTGVSEMALPSKLTAYLSSGRAIVAAVDPNSETAKEILVSGAGRVTQPGDPEALLSTIMRLCTNPTLLETLGRSGKMHAAKYLSPESALAEFGKLLTWASNQAPFFAHEPAH